MNNKDFIISCVGEYENSGAGTGAFLKIRNSNVSVIDLIDSTGLFQYNGLIFRVIRKLKLIVVYDKDGIKTVIKVPEVHDAHDILVDEDFIYCVSTGNNRILKYDHFGKLLDEIRFEGEGDAWHLNCLRKVDDMLFCTAFGQFDSHRQWEKLNYSKSGVIYNVSEKKIVKTNLFGPHNPLFLDGRWFVCDSLNFSLVVFEGEKEVERVFCGGFTRGLTYDDENLFVGVSANRKKNEEKHSRVLSISRKTYKIVNSISVPFPEIYDIILSEHDFNTDKLESFKLDSSDLILKVKAAQRIERPGYLFFVKKIIKKRIGFLWERSK